VLFQTETTDVGNAPNVSNEQSKDGPLPHDLACPACGCIHQSARLVALEYGGQVSNHSEEWRKHCEARWVLKKKKTKNTRQGYLSVVIEKRGEQAARELREEMMRIWRHRNPQT
jgi:ribosomal protein S17E